MFIYCRHKCVASGLSPRLNKSPRISLNMHHMENCFKHKV